MSVVNLENICVEVCEIAKLAGEFIANERLTFDGSKVEHKGLHDLVSYVDRQAETLIVERLKSIVPDAGFIAEEGTASSKGEEYNWIIDPLDGTTNFIQGIPVFSVSIALMYKEELVLGVVYEIGRKECFYAWKDGGAYLNGKRIKVAATNDMHQALLATGFPYTNFNGIDSYVEFLKWAMMNSRGVRRLGSAAVDLAYTAAGRFDAFWEYDLKAWDVAAGALIVKEAGGLVTDFKGENNFVFGRQIIASNNLLKTELLEKLNSIMFAK